MPGVASVAAAPAPAGSFPSASGIGLGPVVRIARGNNVTAVPVGGK